MPNSPLANYSGYHKMLYLGVYNKQIGVIIMAFPNCPLPEAERLDNELDKFLKSVSELGEFPNDVLETIEEARRNEVPSKREAL